MKARIFWGALAFILLVLALSTSSPMVYRILFALLAVPLLGYLGSVLSARRLEGGVRRITPYLQVGETLEEQITVRNLHWFPKLLLEAEHSSRPFGVMGRVLTLWPYRTSTWTVQKHCERRGIYEYGELTVTSRDPLGLFNRTIDVGHHQTAVIYPATVELPGFHVPSGQGWTEGMIKGRTFSPSPVASAVREYVSGDAVSHVHWPTTARTGKLMVKEFEREPSGPADAIWILLDLNAAAQAGGGSESTVEYGVTVAASIAKRFLDTGRTLGLVVAGSERLMIRPEAGVVQQGRILQALALVEPGLSSTLADSASTTAAELSKGASVVIVSPSPLTEMVAAINTLQTSGASVVPIVLEASSFVGRPAAAGSQYRIPGTATEAYVIHRGDEIQRRLDQRLYGLDQGPNPAGMATR